MKTEKTKRFFVNSICIVHVLLLSLSNNFAQDFHTSNVKHKSETKEVVVNLPFLGSKTIKVDIVNNKLIYQGDIKVKKSNSSGRSGTAITGSSDYLWPNSVIPYTIDPSMNNFSSDIVWACQELTNKTNLYLYELKNPSEQLLNSHINFIKDKSPSCGGSSYVDKQPTSIAINSVHTIDLNFDFCSKWSVSSKTIRGIIIHEILHAAGFYHEQSRKNRDKYVRINWSNIESNEQHNFEKYFGTISLKPTTDPGYVKFQYITRMDIGPYDYNSIMHYGPTAFSNKKDPVTSLWAKTIEPLKTGVAIGQRQKLSSGDISAINKVYPTPGKAPLLYCWLQVAEEVLLLKQFLLYMMWN
jgi:hypothetical protein